MTGVYVHPFPGRSACRSWKLHAMMRHRHGYGSGGFGGPSYGHRRRMRRGDVRAAILVLLAEQPYNGYGLMQEIESRSEGVWRPSPGSVYPALQQLEDEGLVRAEERDGRKLYALTDAGRAYVEERGDALGEPWTAATEQAGDEMLELRRLVGQVGAAEREYRQQLIDVDPGGQRVVV